MPRFNEKDPDTLCKHITNAKGWLDVDRGRILGSDLLVRAPEVYSTVSSTDCLDYSKVKSAVLKACEAYRYNFSNWESTNT